MGRRQGAGAGADKENAGLQDRNSISAKRMYIPENKE